LREQALELRAQNSSLAAKAQSAWLSSVSLDTRLEQTRAALVRLRARTRAIAARRQEAEKGLRIARRTLTVSQLRLGDRLRERYEQGDTDALTVLVGSTSIEEAISSLDNVRRIAGQDRRVIDEAKSAQERLVAATERLAGQEAEARATEEATAASLAALEQARREEAAMLATLRAENNSNSAEISTLESRAGALEAAQSRAVAAQLPAPVGGARSLTVTATGYSLPGTTATGVPVGYGIVAVDPAVIPLGTHLTIPGYGEGVAADTGGSVVGTRIDLWFPTESEALSWGTRLVTVTLH
jgi:3D (Asp-Asp-Asp) domain-containing protein